MKLLSKGQSFLWFLHVEVTQHHLNCGEMCVRWYDCANVRGKELILAPCQARNYRLGPKVHFEFFETEFENSR